LVVDVLGLPLAILIHPADIQDRDGGLKVIAMAIAKFPTLKKIWADGGYAGQCIVNAREQSGVDLEIVKRSDQGAGALWQQDGEEPPISAGFKVVKWRWLVERTFGWLGRHRRLSKDYEGTNESSLACVRFALVWLLMRRLAAG
jgi:putative transposase